MKEKVERREEISLSQLTQLFPNDLAAEKWFECLRWPSGIITCPKCDNDNIQQVYGRKPCPYRCRKCRTFFSVRKGSAMEGTNIGLQKWAFAVYLMTTSPKGIPSTRAPHGSPNIHGRR